MLTQEQIEELRAALTWGDQQYGKGKSGGTDQDATLKHAMHRAAKRAGLVEESATLDEFLDVVRLEDLNAALDDTKRNPTPSDNTPT